MLYLIKCDLESKPSESELETKQLEADEVKTENIEVFEDTSHSILFAAQGRHNYLINQSKEINNLKFSQSKSSEY